MGEKQKIKVEKLPEDWTIKPGKMVRVTEMKHIIEIMALKNEPSNLASIKKLSKDNYVDLRDGQIMEYKHTENRSENEKGVKRTIRQIRNIINNNFEGAANELWVTCSYAENMTDTVRLYEDCEAFYRKLKNMYGKIDYITIAEPQGRGAWHTHSLIRFKDHEKIRIENNTEMWPLWGQGFTKTQRLKNVDNIGAYLSAYLADIEICEENRGVIEELMNDGKMGDVQEKEITDEKGRKVKKRYIKGARLYLYPTGFNMYRCSRGIVKPETVQKKYGEVKKQIGSQPAAYRKAIGISSAEKPLNKIYYEQYNLKREKGQEDNSTKDKPKKGAN